MPKKRIRNSHYCNRGYFEKRVAFDHKPRTIAPFCLNIGSSELKPGLLTILFLTTMIVASAAEQMQQIKQETASTNSSASPATKTKTFTNATNTTSILNPEVETGITSNLKTTTNKALPLPEITKQEIRSLLDQKMTLDSSTKQQKDVEACAELKKKIVNLTETFSPAKSAIVRTLSHNNFEVVCVPHEAMKIEAPGNLGLFSHELEKIYLSNAAELDAGSINHEFTHADVHFLHKTPQCYIDNNDETRVPIYPVTHETIQRYNKTLDIGDNRIRDYQRLRLKQHQGKTLSNSEATRLQLYNNASKDCLTSTFIYNVDKTDFIEIKDFYLKTKDKDGIIIKQDNGEKIRFTEFKHDKSTNQYFIYMLPIDPAYYIIDHLTTLSSKIEEGRITDQTILGKLSERDAYTFSHLSQLAREVFYKEANKIREAFFSQCSNKPFFNIRY